MKFKQVKELEQEVQDVATPQKLKFKERDNSKGKKETQAYNDVIEETASKLVEKKKNKVTTFCNKKRLIDFESKSEFQMDMLLQPYDKECMKMAMLKHEETFKEQVYELHRLYRVQKMLMNSIKTNQANGYVNYIYEEQQKPRRKLDLERPAEEHIMDEGANNGMLGLGRTSFRQRKKDDTSLNSDTGPSFSSSSNESSYVQRRNTNNNTRKQADNREEFTAGNKWGLMNNCDVDEQSRQEGKKTISLAF